MINTQEIIKRLNIQVDETVVLDEEIFGDATEFFNKYFGLVEHPFTEKEIGWLSDFSFAIKADCILWKSFGPKTKEQVDAFYRATPFEFFKNLKKNMDAMHLNIFLKVVGQFASKGYKKILNYGDGSGYFSLRFKQEGYDVTYAEVSKISLEWFRYVTYKRGIDIPIIDLTREPIKEKYDVIFMKDVLEHVENPKALLEHLKKFSSNILVSGESVVTEDWLPMHYALKVGEVIDNAE